MSAHQVEKFDSDLSRSLLTSNYIPRKMTVECERMANGPLRPEPGQTERKGKEERRTAKSEKSAIEMKTLGVRR